MTTDTTDDVPRPYAVQVEHNKQRGGIRFHYAFIYVCRFAGQDEALQMVEGYQPRWLSLDDIEQTKDIRPYDNVIRRYRMLLNSLSAGRPAS